MPVSIRTALKAGIDQYGTPHAALVRLRELVGQVVQQLKQKLQEEHQVQAGNELLSHVFERWQRLQKDIYRKKKKKKKKKDKKRDSDRRDD